MSRFTDEGLNEREERMSSYRASPGRGNFAALFVPVCFWIWQFQNNVRMFGERRDLERFPVAVRCDQDSLWLA